MAQQHMFCLGMLCAIAGVLIVWLITRPALHAYWSPPKKRVESFAANISMQTTTGTSGAIIDYAIKSSYHTAYDASTNSVSLDQLRKVLARGVRWVDFDVFSIDHEPAVGFSVKTVGSLPQQTQTTVETGMNQATNSIPLVLVLEELNRSAFDVAGAPNPGDPLFINLRIKSADAAIYPIVQTSFANTFGTLLYSSRLDTATTPLQDIMGKAVFVLDTINSAPNISAQCDNSYVACAQAKSMRSIAALTCGTSKFPLVAQDTQLKLAPTPVMPGDPGDSEGEDSAQNPLVRATLPAVTQLAAPEPGLSTSSSSSSVPANKSQSKRSTTAVRFRCSPPAIQSALSGSNPSIIAFWRDYGIQVVPYRFYLDDAGLEEYEQMFADNGHCAFIPLATAVGVATRK